MTLLKRLCPHALPYTEFSRSRSKRMGVGRVVLKILRALGSRPFGWAACGDPPETRPSPRMPNLVVLG